MSEISPNTPKILIVDDEMILRESLAAWLERDGYYVSAVASGEEALDLISKESFDIVFLDLKLEGMDGIEVLARIKEIDPEIPIVMITAYGSITTAVEAMKKGASDYLLKPFEPDELSMLIEKILQSKATQLENLYLKETIKEKAKFDKLLGQSSKMQEVFELIKRVAPIESTVLITGETGTGKELVARAIHSHSKRKDGPFVAINCGAIPEQLMESEIFGHEKGAFTDAKEQRKGKLELACGGTIFLDEVGELTLKMQVNLLRVLEEKSFYRVGGSKPISLDARVLAATNRDLKKGIEQGWFREDLYYRLNVFSISLPPLRERKEDIPLLAKHFLMEFSKETNKHVEKISRQAMDLMMLYDWPGNVRELKNAIERAVVICQGKVIQPEDLPISTRMVDRKNQDEKLSLEGETLPLRELEKKYILNILDKTKWNISLSAKILGIDRSTLYNKIKKYGLKR